MSLTKPKLSQLTFAGIPDFPVSFPDTALVLNNNGAGANIDVGLVFNRSLGVTSNVAIYWNEATQSFITAHTNDAGVTDANIVPTSYANLTSGVVTANTIYTETGIFYANGAPAGGSPGGSLGSMQFNNNQTLDGSQIYYNPITGNTVVETTTPSTSFDTGAVVIKGGLGVAGDAYISHVYTDGLFWAGNSQIIQTGGGGGVMSMDWGYIVDPTTIATQLDFGTLDGTGYSVTTMTLSEFLVPPPIGPGGDLMNSSELIDMLEPTTRVTTIDLA